MGKRDRATLITEAIWDDICSRSGGDHFLEGCCEDVQQEIRETWQDLVREILEES